MNGDDDYMGQFRSDVLVGREYQLSMLREAADRAHSGCPTTVLIFGEAGIGKSRLAAGLTEELGRDSALVLQSHGIELAGGELPFGGVTEMLRDLTHQIGPEQVRARAGPEASSLAALVPALSEEAARAHPGLDRVAVLTAVLTLLEAASRDRTVCWLVEDLQWLDEGSRDIACYLSRVVRDSRLLLLLTERTEDGEELPDEILELQRTPGCLSVDLPRLTPDEVAEQVRGIAGDVDAATLERVCRLSDGVPFLVEELLASDLRGEHAVPLSLRRLILTRLPRLSNEARGVVDAASLAEGHLRHNLLESVCRLPGPVLDRAIGEAIELGVLLQDPDRDGYAFRHALVREAVEESLLPSLRRLWHRRWAEALGDSSSAVPGSVRVVGLARHWLQSGDVERGFDAAVEAAWLSARMGDHVQEAAWWRRALKAWPAVRAPEKRFGGSRDDVLQLMFRAMELSGQYEQARALIEGEMAGSSGDDWLRRLWLATWRRHTINLTNVHPEDVVTASEVDRVVDRLVHAPASFYVVNALHFLMHEWESRRPDLCVSMCDAMERVADEIGDDENAFFAVRQRAWYAEGRGDGEGALRLRLEALERAKATSTSVQLLAQSDLVWARAILGDYRGALAFGADALAGFREPRAAPPLWAELAGTVAGCMLSVGRWDDAEALVDRALALRPGPWQIAAGQGTKAVIALYRGDLETARRLRDEAVAVFELDAQDAESVSSAAWTRGMVAAGGHDLAAMREALDPVWHLPDIEALSSIVLWDVVIMAAREEAAQARLGGPTEREAALDQLATVRAVGERLHKMGDLGKALSSELEAQLAYADAADTAEQWNRVVESWRKTGRVLDEGICRTRLAERLVADGRRDDAHRELAAALDIAEALGANPLAAEVRAVARRGRVALVGGYGDAPGRAVRDLTAREREVLGLLAQGRTNEQIAGTLFMSPKTASVHVSRIIAKLGVSNRTEAAAVAHRQGLVTSDGPVQ